MNVFASSPVARHRIISWPTLGFAALLAVYALLLATHQSPAIVGVDDNGYFAQGTLLADTGRTWFTPQSDAQYIGMHWLLTPKGHYISRYPPGLAAAIAVLDRLGGYKLAIMINPICALLTLVALFLSVSTLLKPVYGLIAAVLLASLPVFSEKALAGDSHMSVAACIAWALSGLLRWAKEPTLTKALLIGVVLGIIPTIRYPDVVMIFAAALFVWMQRRSVPQFWKHVGFAAIGMAVVIVPLLIRNQLVLGAFWRTGYALTGEQTGFSVAYFKQHAVDYVRQVSSSGVGLPTALGLLGFTIMIAQRETRALGLLLTGIAVPMMLVYMAYYWAPQGDGAMTMRFLVPTFAAYIFAAVYLLAQLAAAVPTPARIAMPLVLIAVQAAVTVPEIFANADRTFAAKRSLSLATDALGRVAATGDVVIADASVLADFDFVHRYKLADVSLVSGIGGGPGGGGPGGGGPGGFDGGPGGGGGMRRGDDGGGGGMRPDGEAGGPSPMQAEKQALQRTKYTGTTTQRFTKFQHDVTTWSAGQSIWFVGSREEMTRLLGSGAATQIVQTIDLPQPPPEQRGIGRMGGPMGQRGGMGVGPMGGQGMGGGPMNGMFGNGPMGGRRGGMGGGPGGGGPGGGGPGGGGPGMNAFGGATQIVIAKWTPSDRRIVMFDDDQGMD